MEENMIIILFLLLTVYGVNYGMYKEYMDDFKLLQFIDKYWYLRLFTLLFPIWLLCGCMFLLTVLISPIILIPAGIVEIIICGKK